MNTKQKKPISKLVFLALIFIISVSFSYWGIQMYKFIAGTKNNAKENIVNIQNDSLQNGDIIFQTSKSRQSMAIQIATKSEYSHVGIIYLISGKYMVFEAVQPVKLTPLNEWINRGKNGKYVIKRLNDEFNLNQENLAKMKEIGNSYVNKDYDLYFNWSDEKMYCSELVWKIYKFGANIEIGKLQQLKDFDLSNKEVKKVLKKRYGDNIPLEETVISPVSIFNCEKLKTIAQN